MILRGDIRPFDETLRGLLSVGIDDLAKYRIVQHLSQCGPTDAPSLAASLGLHPRELVAEALERLVAKGLLVREQWDPPLYVFNPPPVLRRALDRFLCPTAPQETCHIFRALAAASLAKARARSHGNGGR